MTYGSNATLDQGEGQTLNDAISIRFYESPHRDWHNQRHKERFAEPDPLPVNAVIFDQSESHRPPSLDNDGDTGISKAD